MHKSYVRFCVMMTAVILLGLASGTSFAGIAVGEGARKASMTRAFATRKQLPTPSNKVILSLLPNGRLATASEVWESTRTDLDHDGIDEIVGIATSVRGPEHAWLFSLRQKQGRWVEDGDIVLPNDTYAYWMSPRPAMRVATGRPARYVVTKVREDAGRPLVTSRYNYPFGGHADHADLARISDLPRFVSALRAAVAKCDRAALKHMMPEDFEFSFGAPEGGDPRDNAFRAWDRSGARGWQELERVLAKGYKSDKRSRFIVVFPPEFLRGVEAGKDIGKGAYTGYRACVEKRSQYWRFVWFVEGD